MHELGITRNVVAIVGEQAAGRRVLRVTLEVGRLSGLMADAIRFCFDVCTADTPLAGAVLEIVEPEGRGRCTACGAEHALQAPTGRCPSCAAPALRIVAGEELTIREMEVETCA